MCMIESADDVLLVLKERDVKAVKPHKCVECGRQIQAGETYHSEAGVLDGDFQTYKTCLHCMVARDWLISECGGFLYQSVREDLEEHAKECFDVKLNRLIVGMRRKWRRFYGDGLLPLPRRAAEREQGG